MKYEVLHTNIDLCADDIETIHRNERIEFNPTEII